MRRIMAAAPAAALALLAAAPDPARASEELLDQACGGCHERGENGLSRIAGQRKTPEGWLMTIVRMRIAHGVDISPEDQAALVSYLADTHGLAPSETADWRYALEKDPAAIEAIEAPFDQMCARCHTGARFRLQHRTPEEWALHIDFHVGQFPTAEYQALGRDRHWYEIARDEIAPLLAEQQPFETEAWTAWQAAEKPQATGDWVVLVDIPAKGAAYGTLSVSGDASPYEVSGELTTAGGDKMPVKGKMNLYTGYEWRANLDIGGETYRQVLAISEDGASLEGRQFLRGHDSLGGRLKGARADGPATVLGVTPEAVPSEKAAEGFTVQLVGVGLSEVDVAAEGGVAENLTQNATGATVSLRTDIANSTYTFTAGDSSATAALYDGVDRIAVEPDFAIARVGGGDEGPARVPIDFKAVGYWNGPDGEPDTEDDIRVGALPAEWSVGNHDEIAETMDDAKFAGEIDAATGMFTPALAGPNPDRPYSTNNAGDLKVTAKAAGLEAEAQLIVTVQRFIDPPLR